MIWYVEDDASIRDIAIYALNSHSDESFQLIVLFFNALKNFNALENQVSYLFVDLYFCGCSYLPMNRLLCSVTVINCMEHASELIHSELILWRKQIFGHIFKLGTRYTDALNLKYVDENNQEKLMIMGCYGIGIERVISSIIEQHNDERGIAFPSNMAPFKANIIVINTKDEAQVKLAEEIYETLQDAGVETLLDDRSERFGVKLADSELIGIPYNIIVGKRASEGVVEFQKRRGDKLEALAGEILQKIQ